ncbi:MAG: TRAP transporter large permease [Clostridiales Family XIII bacterium]|jgi:C4-dicarboxylate transporter DctM subunit|nr:TRAP transporter large permease [Clostridiales Family XIII bacterium]
MAAILIVIIVVLVVCLFIGTPVSSALGFTACVTMVAFMGTDHLIRFGVVGFQQGTSVNQMVAPLFIIMAEFLARGGIAEDIFEVLNRVLRKVKGGLALSTTLACTVFAALCGSSPATAAAVGKISIHAMIRRNYAPSFAVGTVAAGGTLGIMIPPSITFVFYGIITETSIAKLLMAGLLPGIMLAVLLCISIMIRVRLNPKLLEHAETEAKKIDGEKSEKKQTAKAAAVAIPAMIIILLVLGTMYSGVATPTEAAGYGAIGAFLVVLFQRRITKKIFGEVLQASARTTCMILFLVIMGLTLSYAISYLGLAQNIATTIAGSGTSPWMVMIMLFVLWFVMGCMMDPGSMVILTIPFIFPTLVKLGFDPIWIGVVSTLCVEIGMITPPVGLNLFVLKSVVPTVSMSNIMRGTLSYVGVLLVGLVILCIFPNIALFLPGRM